jgi:hypothetical protein
VTPNHEFSRALVVDDYALSDFDRMIAVNAALTIDGGYLA